MYHQRLSKKHLVVFFFLFTLMILVARHLSLISFQGPPAFWPATGLIFAYYTFTRVQEWPKLFVLSIVGWCVANQLSDISKMYLPLFWIAGTTSQLIGVSIYLFFLRRNDKSDYAAVFGFILIGGVAVPALTATLNTFIAGISGLEPLNLITWRFHFAASSLGVLTISPFTLSMLRESRIKGWVREFELVDLGLLAMVTGVTCFVFGPFKLALEFRSIFFIFPFMAMVALRGKLSLTATVNLMISLISIGLTLLGYGPFRFLFASPIEVMTSLQFFVIASILTLVLLTVAIQGRRKLSEDLVSRGLELERLNEDLIRAKQSAFDASEAKSRFLADMSHEIRSPLGAMTGFAELILAENATADDRKRYGQIIKRNGLHLSELVNQILDISKIEAGKFEIESKPIVVRDFFESVIELMEIKAREKGLELRLSFDGEIPATFVSDPLRLRQILLNSIGNAIKFTSAGNVTIRVSSKRDFGHPAQLICEIQDSGIGINIDEQKRLFQAFSQANSSTARLFGGTGLGLTLSRQLAKLLGGDYELVRSVQGIGSTFRFYIFESPVAESVKPASSIMKSELSAPRLAQVGAVPVAKLSLLGRRILIADDSVDSQLLVSLFLKSEGATIEVCGDGKRAVELALSRNFDLVLMDVEMPKMSGREAIRQLRARGYQRLVLAMTGHAMPDEVAKFADLGFDGSILKPIEKAKLIARVNGVLRLQAPAATQQVQT